MITMAVKNSNSTTNLSPNIAGALCYVPFVGWIAAIVLLIVEKNSAVKWHAAQSLLLMGFLWALALVLGATIVWVVGLVLQLVMAVKTYQGQAMKLPVLGGLADKIAGKV